MHSTTPLLASSLLSLAFASPVGAYSLTFTQDIPSDVGRVVNFTVTEQFDHDESIYGRLYWTWCYGDYVSSSQGSLGPGWTPFTITHLETDGSLDYAELWNQWQNDGISTSGTISSTVGVYMKMPVTPVLFEFLSTEGIYSSYWVYPGSYQYVVPSVPSVPEPSGGLLMGLGLMMLARQKRCA